MALKRTLAVLLAAGMVAAGCSAAPSPSTGGSASPSNSQASEPAGSPTGGTLRIAKAFDVNNWDIAVSNTEGSLNHSIAVYATLLRASSDGTELEPYLADSWTHNDDWTEFSFKLNPDAAFCDGSPMTAADVVWSWDRAVPSPSVSWMFPEGITYSAPDPQTLNVKMPAPNVAFPWWTTLWGMMVLSKAYGQDATAETLASKPLGSGPFCLESWDRSSQINLTRNEHFWLKDDQGTTLPYVDKVEWVIVPDANARVLKLRAGEVEIAEDVAANQVETLKTVSGIAVGTSPLLGTGVLVLNKRTPFSDPKIRQAANYAVDKEALIDTVLAGLGQPAYSFLSGGLYSNDAYGYKYDLDKAKALMASSSQPGGFSVTMNVKSGDPIAEQVGVVMKDQLSKIGIELTLNPLESGTYSSLWQAGDFDIVFKTGTLDIYDSSENLNFDVNLGGYGGIRDESLWALAQEASAQPDPAKRAAQFDELQRRWMEAPPYVLLFTPVNAWATSDKVQGYKYLNSGAAPMDKVTLSK